MISARSRRRVPAAVLAIALAAGACSSTEVDGATTAAPTTPPTTTADTATPTLPARDFGTAPTVPDGDLAPPVQEAVDSIFESVASSDSLAGNDESIAALGAAGDPRVAWWFSDLLRFTQASETGVQLTEASNKLLGLSIDPQDAWGDLTDHLIAWDIPAPPNYLEHKRALFTAVVPEWEPLFDAGGDVDWRHVSWGGVGIDDRPFDQTEESCNCIPAADNPEVTDAAGGDWYPDEGVVFGVEIDGEARAYPRNIMEIREMVNDTLGGRDIAMPYCTLCGSAQVYFTDEVPDGVERPVLRTSGLLIRSNKVMYDVNTSTVFDTFLGSAVAGPLAEQDIVLPQHSVITTTWGEWKDAHPDTTILDESLALGRDSDLRNTRDADGPIFPIGDVDPRLGVQEDVVGVTTESGTPVAFHVATASSALAAGEEVRFENIELILDGGGVKAVDENGDDAGGHQAFWFAWSQFHPDTELWNG